MPQTTSEKELGFDEHGDCLTLVMRCSSMGSRQRPIVSPENLSAWCMARFESPLSNILFESGYSSAVFGIVLGDDRRVVVKVRAWHERLVSCWRVHRQMWEAGFPCPEPLGPPERHNSLA